MSHHHTADVEHLRLQVAVALGVVPLISKPIAFLDDRHTIIGDIVTSWLALPEETKTHYAQTGPHVSPIVSFGWDYVEAVEHNDQLTQSPHPFDQGPHLTDEQVTFHRWMKHLELTKTRQVNLGDKGETGRKKIDAMKSDTNRSMPLVYGTDLQD